MWEKPSKNASNLLSETFYPESAKDTFNQIIARCIK